MNTKGRKGGAEEEWVIIVRFTYSGPFFQHMPLVFLAGLEHLLVVGDAASHPHRADTKKYSHGLNSLTQSSFSQVCVIALALFFKYQAPLKKIIYRTEKGDQASVSYFVEPHADEAEVRWSFYPHLPEGMCAKKGDERGLGSFHHDTRQSFEDFKIRPAREISDAIYEQVMSAMGGLSELEMITRKMGPSGMEFNRVSMPSFAQLKSGLSEPRPASQLSDHDLFPSWTFIKEIKVEGETRLLLRCAEYGMMWVHVDETGMTHASSQISNEEARELYKKHLLYFTEGEKEKLKEALQIGNNFEEALKTALGRMRVMDSFFLPESPSIEIDGCITMAMCVEDAGIISATLTKDGTLVDYRLIQGLEAWRILQPIIDPVVPE
ncbi:hypothetical protein JIN77_04205 [Verrucomicrobiaceae bacterium R5-34]|nr:hypothetical protein [Verrucomicrobiaceae bacterium R5-34]